MEYYISNLSLNMLAVFDAVCRTGNMTRASEKLNLSQPAISRYVKELTYIVGQDLFVKTKEGFHLTQTGVELWEEAKEILKRCEAFTRYSKVDFNPHEHTREFTLSISLHNTNYLLQKLSLDTIEVYPNIHINLIHLTEQQAINEIEDLAISGYIGEEPNYSSNYLEKEVIANIDYKIICSNQSQYYNNETIEKDDFIHTPHIRIKTAAGETYMDRELTAMGLMQKTLYDVPDNASMLQMIKKMDMLFITHAQHAEHLCQENSDLKILEPHGFELPRTKLYFLWNRSHTDFSPYKWLRSYIREQLKTS